MTLEMTKVSFWSVVVVTKKHDSTMAFLSLYYHGTFFNTFDTRMWVFFPTFFFNCITLFPIYRFSSKHSKWDVCYNSTPLRKKLSSMFDNPLKSGASFSFNIFR